MIQCPNWWGSSPSDDPAVAPTRDGLPLDGRGQSPRCSRELWDLIDEWHSCVDTSHLRKLATKHLPHVLSGRIQLHLDAVSFFPSDGVVRSNLNPLI
ncbi:MAG: hypothetical protein Q8P67_02185 [archaeon]|nr:hypothetical protein [archaeon]